MLVRHGTRRSHAVTYHLLRPRHNSTNATRAQNVRPLESILIANRGEIAIRVNKTAAQHGIRTTTLYTDPDAAAQHAHSSPRSFNLGPTAAYLDQAKILRLAKDHACQAIHPGYGFLSENAEFARKCAEAGITFIGPPPNAIEDMGDKARSKEIMTAAGVLCVPGYHGSDQSPDKLADEAEKIGYPVLIKAVRGGGGKGMRIVQNANEFQDMLDSARSEARNSFGNDEVLVEKYITTPRHIEVQVFADKYGNSLALGERDCSIQRRHQKILEESPAPELDDSIRKDLWAKARAAAEAVNYEGAGTVEFIFDNDTGKFYFMEMNTRLQVEHPVTEMVTGLDLVHWQIMVAEGRRLPLTQDQVEEQIKSRGHAIEARIYAENPDKGFIPDSGKLSHVRLPATSEDIRIDTGFVEGDTVSSHYDPMIAKLIVRGESREDAVRKLAVALEEYEVAGPVTNIDFLKRCCVSKDFAEGRVETGYIPKHHDELFAKRVPTPEVLIEAAVASLIRASRDVTGEQALTSTRTNGFSWLAPQGSLQQRTFHFRADDDEPQPGTSPTIYEVQVQQLSVGRYYALCQGSAYEIASTYDADLKTYTTYFPHTRHTSRIIMTDSSEPGVPGTAQIHLFTPQGSFRLQSATPAWIAKALGTSEKANSLLSPMPCKILRVDVKPGDKVKKDQTLLVIESMKMETVIRSPGEGLVVKRIVHGQGEVVGSGVELVEFEEVE
ncbi:hypothetical protein H2198_008463 [Neophaeococcomyces mojaviensis]|uniref:Uncharacterized protein n=1 Tax=Neophaeococcomyces mojaviensis TaxID=3383035 RepID=A0ACC2ZX41_9EURO|nr:hypothetical protein H2198_008463 [Knufia sp. JES_112]